MGSWRTRSNEKEREEGKEGRKRKRDELEV